MRKRRRARRRQSEEEMDIPEPDRPPAPRSRPRSKASKLTSDEEEIESDKGPPSRSKRRAKSKSSKSTSDEEESESDTGPSGSKRRPNRTSSKPTSYEEESDTPEPDQPPPAAKVRLKSKSSKSNGQQPADASVGSTGLSTNPDSSGLCAPANQNGASVFQCASCRTIFADTVQGYIAANQKAGTISFSSVRRITTMDKLEVSTDDWHAGCAFRRLACKECEQFVGWRFTSTTPALDHVRDGFTFDKRTLISYQLGSCGPKPAPPVVSGGEEEAGKAYRRLIEEDLGSISAAVAGLAEGLTMQCGESREVREAMRRWDGRFRRLEELDGRLREVLGLRSAEQLNDVPVAEK